MTETTNEPRRRLLSGLEYMRAVAAGEIPPSPMSRLFHINIAEVSAGRVVMTAEPGREFENGLRIAHGGFVATLLDSVLGGAVNSVMPAGKIFTTLEMKINYIHAVTRVTGKLIATATLVHSGARTAVSEGRVEDENGKVYAHGTATCILFRDTTEER